MVEERGREEMGQRQGFEWRVTGSVGWGREGERERRLHDAIVYIDGVTV